MKKTIFFIVIATICLFSVQSFALEDETTYEIVNVCFEDVVYLNQMFETSLYTYDDNLEERYENAKQALLSGVKNFESNFDISQYEIPYDLRTSLFSDIFLYNPELFYIQSSCGFSGKKPSYSSSYIITEVNFFFAYTPSEYASRKKDFDNEVEKIISLVKPNMGELERALIVHDYIDLHYKYDTTPIGTDDEGNDIYKDSSFRADGVIVEKVGVCQSYSMAYYYIMNLLGVETDYVESTAMVHMWNIFRIGENWYHVDSTWDDPVPDEYAYVSHQHFLASDDLIGSGDNKHYDWVANHECTDTSLDNHFWRNITGAIALDGQGKAYYHTPTLTPGQRYHYFEIISHDLETHDMQVIKTENGKYWYDSVLNGYITLVLSDVLYFNGKLYYNTPTEIIEMNTDGSDERIVAYYETDDVDEDGQIYGCMLDGPELYYGVEQHLKCQCDQPEHKLIEYFILLDNYIKAKSTVGASPDILVSVKTKNQNYENIPGKIIATLYDENDIVKEAKILTLSECNLTGPDATTPVNFESETGAYIKLMWWDMDTISPLAKNIKYHI